MNLKLNHPLVKLLKSICKSTKPGISVQSDLLCEGFCSVNAFTMNPFEAEEAVGQTIECMDGSFDVHEWCLYHSDILLSFYEENVFKITTNILTVCFPKRSAFYSIF